MNTIDAIKKQIIDKRAKILKLKSAGRLEEVYEVFKEVQELCLEYEVANMSLLEQLVDIANEGKV